MRFNIIIGINIDKKFFVAILIERAYMIRHNQFERGHLALPPEPAPLAPPPGAPELPEPPLEEPELPAPPERSP